MASKRLFGEYRKKEEFASETPKKVMLYTRSNTRHEKDWLDDIQTQLKDLTEYATCRGYVIVGYITRDAVITKNWDETLQEMRRKNCNTLLVSDYYGLGDICAETVLEVKIGNRYNEGIPKEFDTDQVFIDRLEKVLQEPYPSIYNYLSSDSYPYIYKFYHDAFEPVHDDSPKPISKKLLKNPKVTSYRK